MQFCKFYDLQIINRTVELAVDWLAGNVSVVRNLTTTPFPFRLAVTPHSLAVISMVCCEPCRSRTRHSASTPGRASCSSQYSISIVSAI